MLRAVVRFVLFAALAMSQPIASGEPFPSQPIKLVVAQAPGGQNDTIARAFAQRLSERWNTPVVIVNHGGVGGTIGADIVAKAPADGYTLLFGGSFNLAIAPALMPDLSYSPTRDFVAIGGVARAAYALAVNASLPVHTLPQLVAYARANPGRLNYGSSGNGSTSNLGAELLMTATNIRMVHIPYKGTAPAIAELVAGRIDLMFADLSQLIPHAKAGTLRLIAAAGDTRPRAAPDLPTVREQGVSMPPIDAWYGLLAPAGTPPEVVAKLTNALNEVVREPDFRHSMAQLGYDPMDNSRQALRAVMESDIRKYSAIIKQAGITTTP